MVRYGVRIQVMAGDGMVAEHPVAGRQVPPEIGVRDRLDGGYQEHEQNRQCEQTGEVKPAEEDWRLALH
jgi:hypothetical protein